MSRKIHINYYKTKV